MGLTMEQKRIVSIICRHFFDEDKAESGCNICPLYRVCSLSSQEISGNTEEEKIENYEQQLWTLAEKVNWNRFCRKEKGFRKAKENRSVTNVKVISNGYTLSESLQNIVKRFETKSKELLSPKEIEFFYYGDCLVMTSVTLANNNYGHFHISTNRVSFNGHSCTADERKDFESLTWNDELFEGKLFDENEKMEEMKNE